MTKKLTTIIILIGTIFICIKAFSRIPIGLANTIDKELTAIIDIQNLDKIGENFNKSTQTITKETPFSLNLDGSNSTAPEKEKLSYRWIYPEGKILDSKNPRSYRFEKAGNYTIELTITDSKGNTDSTSLNVIALQKQSFKKSKSKNKKTTKFYQNGDLEDSIIISEFFPNPKGQDKGAEFIELYNPTNTAVNLGNWKIRQQSDQGVVSEILMDNSLKIPAKSSLTLKNLKKALRNSANIVSLIDFQDKTIDKLKYKNSVEALSLSRILIKNTITKREKYLLQWTKPTPGEKNPGFYIVHGEILKSNSTKAPYILEIQIHNSKKIELIYEEKISPNLAKIAFAPGKKIEAIIAKQSDKYEIIKLKISNDQNNQYMKPDKKTMPLTKALIVLVLVNALITLHYNKKL